MRGVEVSVHDEHRALIGAIFCELGEAVLSLRAACSPEALLRRHGELAARSRVDFEGEFVQVATRGVARPPQYSSHLVGDAARHLDAIIETHLRASTETVRPIEAQVVLAAL